MAVKDIVSRYESAGAGPSFPRQLATRGFRPLTDSPRPRAARALPTHPPPSSASSSTLYVTPSRPDSAENDAASDTLFDAAMDTHDTPQPTTDVTDDYFDAKKANNTIPFFKRRLEDVHDEYEMRHLLMKRRETAKRFDSDHAIAQVPELPSLASHTPIAASTVFARGAPPLSFPSLDSYLSSMRPPSFPTSSHPHNSPSLFPPMDLLAKSGRTLEDLEKNFEVASWWHNRNTLVGAISSIALSFTGSSALNSFYSLRGLIDILQIFALILNTITHRDQEDKWRQLILGTIPNILALNFGTSTRLALGILLVFMTISGVVLYLFYRSTSLCCRLGTVEGLQQPSYFKHPWAIVLMSLYLTVVYLPLSTMAMHVLVWSDDLWVIPNPYTNATSLPLALAPLGPAAEYRGSAPSRFLRRYTTTIAVISRRLCDRRRCAAWSPNSRYRLDATTTKLTRRSGRSMEGERVANVADCRKEHVACGPGESLRPTHARRTLFVLELCGPCKAG